MLENLVQSPENKIKNASKILDTAASNLNRELTNITKNLLDINSVERKNTETLSKFLFAEDLTKTTRTNAPLITTQGAQQASQVRKQEEQQPKSQTAPSALGALNAPMSGAVLSGRKFGNSENVTSLVSAGNAGTFIAISGYGMRNGRPHTGLDIAGPRGTFIALKFDSEVIDVGNEAKGYGNYIDLWIPSASVRLFFGHCDSIFYKEGDKIPAGRSFATLGSTGRSTGPHIHLEYSKTRNKKTADGPPDAYINFLYLTRTRSAGFTQPQSSTRPAPSSTRTGILTPESRKNQPTSMLFSPQLSQGVNETQLKTPQLPPTLITSNSASLAQIVAMATIR